MAATRTAEGVESAQSCDKGLTQLYIVNNDTHRQPTSHLRARARPLLALTVLARAKRVQRVRDEPKHVLHALRLAQRRRKARLQGAQGALAAAEARQARWRCARERAH